jgi:two-component system, chemotaxis family, chemotaxis protein CheY
LYFFEKQPLGEACGAKMRVAYDKLRFLIVDDNAFMRRILRTILYSFGTREVFDAEDGVTGFEEFKETSPDIVLVDWEMPNLDGIGLTKLLRDPIESANPFVPVIMISSHSERTRIAIARDAGVTEFLAKPISPQGLYDRIHAVVAHPRKFVRTDDFFGPDRRRGAKNIWRGQDRRKGEAPETFVIRSLADRLHNR